MATAAFARQRGKRSKEQKQCEMWEQEALDWPTHCMRNKVVVLARRCLTLSMQSCMGLLCLKHCWRGDLNIPWTTAPLNSPLKWCDAGRGRTCLCFDLSLFLPVHFSRICRVSPQTCTCVQTCVATATSRFEHWWVTTQGLCGCPFPGEQQNITADKTKLGYVTSVTALQLPAQTELGNSWTLLTHLQFRFLRAGLVAPVCLSPCWAGSHNYQVKKSHSSLPFSFKNISLL